MSVMLAMRRFPDSVFFGRVALEPTIYDLFVPLSADINAWHLGH
jgi:hypothetical protein